MDKQDEKEDEERQAWPPLWSIGLAVTIMLIVPAMLYSFLPEGPIREGDTVFANAKHKVALAEPIRHDKAGYDGTCVLELRDPLVVVKRLQDQSEGPFRAQVQGKTRIEFPFCPPQAEVILRPDQVFTKPRLLTDLKESASQLFSR